jgi:APA family basic amino acid/polyamine antiporter
MFVAYTGYGRIATLGEEVKEPRRTIPRAVIVTLGVACLLYLGVASSAIGLVGAERYARETLASHAPLEAIALSEGQTWLAWVVSLAAATAMLGVVLNLLLGLSRVVLAMGRRGDLPARLARLDPATGTPDLATLATGAVVTAMAAFGSIESTWSFSAFTVLVYYAVTNLAAWRMPESARLFPRWVAGLGLVGCLVLAVYVEPRALGLGLVLLGLAFLVRALLGRKTKPAD